MEPGPMKSCATVVLVIASAVAAAAAPPAPPAHEVERSFTVPAGFEIRLVAAEPDLANPMTVCVDEGGAIFVSEAHTYRYGPQGSPVQPPTNPIKRIDLGPDGRAARVSVAADGFPNPVMGLHAHEGRLYAKCLNELFVMDIGADGTLTNRRLLVKDAATPWNPFGMYRVVVGPDGWLWMAVADHSDTGPVTLTGTDGRTVRLRGQSGGMVRCRRDGTGLELVVHGFRVESILDPSRLIKTGWAAETVQTSAGRQLTGLVTAGDGMLTVTAFGAPPVRIPLNDVTARTTLPVSLMPPGLAADWSAGELADLTAWILSPP
jgi:putative heme-binding domain-containing protein